MGPRDRTDEEIFCPSCGERIQRTVNFCRHCGEPIRERREYETAERPTGERDGGHAHEPGSQPWEGGTRGDETRETGPRGAGARGGDAPTREEPEPWETDQTRHAERDIADDVDAGRPQWRAYLPAQTRASDESALQTVLGAVGMGLLGIVLLVVITGIVAGILYGGGLSLVTASLVATAPAQYLGFAGLAFLYLRRRGLDWAAIRGYLGIRRPTLREVGIAVAGWVAALVLLTALSLLIELLAETFGSGSPDQAEQGLDEVLTDPVLAVVAIAAMFLVVAPCEELLFRGIVQGRLRERLSAIPAILLASGLFAVVHVTGLVGSLQGVAIALSVLFTTALVLAAVYEYTGNIVVPILVHGLYNSTVVVVIYVGSTTNLENEALIGLLSALPL
jgi:membrane protease YdiL (CAAX protease family)